LKLLDGKVIRWQTSAVCIVMAALASNIKADVGGNVCSNVTRCPDGRLSLADGVSAGVYSISFDLPKPHPKTVSIRLADAIIPEGDELSTNWPVLACDIITQVRFLTKSGDWTEWMPRNILHGGDMEDSNRDGIPDYVSVMRIRQNRETIFADNKTSAWMPPPTDFWNGKVQSKGRFVDTADAPPGAKQSLRLVRGVSDGQDTAAMRLDLVPPDTYLTVCGWTKCDIAGTSMGVMSRFHEFNESGDRVNKYVILGDDDLHQPSGTSGWCWRALTFQSLPDTTHLNLYPIRMITAQGRAWAANFEIRLGTVFSEWGKGHVVFQEDFETLDRWEVSGAACLSGIASEGQRSLCLKPDPLQVVTATLKKNIKVKPGKMYAFRIAMQNDVPAHYEPTHQAWMSAYLEFYNSKGEFLDYCKVMAFRPTLTRPVGAAMRAPRGAHNARFVLVASHISYGEKTGMNGPMHAYFDALQLEESTFDAEFTPRPKDEIALDVPPDAQRMEVRSFLLSRESHLRPSFKGYIIGYSGHPTNH